MSRKTRFSFFFALFLITAWVIFGLIKPYLTYKYGISPEEILLTFGISEIFFTGSILIILRSSLSHETFDLRTLAGLWKLIKRAHNLKGIKIQLWNKPAAAAWLVNRFSWILPITYLMVRGWDVFPWLIQLLLAAEIILTIGAGYSAIEAVRPEE